jgi:hypothetical protein
MLLVAALLVVFLDTMVMNQEILRWPGIRSKQGYWMVRRVCTVPDIEA